MIKSYYVTGLSQERLGVGKHGVILLIASVLSVLVSRRVAATILAL